MKNAASWFSRFGFRNSTVGPTYRTLSTPEQIRDAIVASYESNSSGSAIRVAAVWACVNLLSRSIASLPAAVYKVKGEERSVAEDHPMHALVAIAPNSISTPAEFFQILITHLLLRGNFYAEKVVFNGKVDALLPLEPGLMLPKMSQGGQLFYEYSQQGKPRRTFSQEQILHVRGLTIDGLVGLSVLGAARQAIEGALATENYGARMFRSGARPSGVLETDLELSEEAQGRLAKQFNESYAGLENAHKTMVLEAGLKWKPVTLDAEDTQFIESRKFARSEIAMFFGVPPHLIGDIDRGTSWGSGIEQQNRGFLIYTLRPYLTNIAQAFARDLLPKKDRSKFVVRFDTSDLERADFGPRQTGLAVMKDRGVINANEWRRLEGLNPREGGNEYESKADASNGGPSDAGSGDPGQNGGAAARADQGNAPFKLADARRRKPG
ncbi:MAG: phage portal protein [Saprospiraceae bacterium]